MDQDDPQNRIAELERQLAEQKHGVVLPPVGPDRVQPGSASNSDPAQRRFGARIIPNTRHTLVTAGLLFALGLVFFAGAVAIYLVAPTNQALIGVLWAVWLVVGVAVVLRRVVFPKRVVICVMTEGLTIDQRPGDVFSFRDATLGQWRGPVQGGGSERAARALYLTCGPHRFVLGERAARVASQVPLDGPQVRRADLDAWTPPQQFDELLAIVGPQRQTTRESDLPPAQPPQPQPADAPQTGSGSSKAARISAQIVSVFAVFCVLGGLGFAMGRGVGPAIFYRLGTPTTATIDHCDDEACYVRWSVGRVSRTGPISGDYDRHGGVGSQVDVHVDGSSDRNGVYHAYTASEASPNYVMVSAGLFAFATGVVLYWCARRKIRTGSWPWSRSVVV